MRRWCIAMAVALGTGPALAETTVTENGGDTYVAGETVTQTLDAAGDVFVAGRSTTILGQTEGDFHSAGFDVVIGIDVAEDAYAAGANDVIGGYPSKGGRIPRHSMVRLTEACPQRGATCC